MSKATQVNEFDEVSDYNGEVGEEDYCFIVGPNGDLKTIFMPDSIPFTTPKKLTKLFKMFGIQDPEKLGNDTIH